MNTLKYRNAIALEVEKQLAEMLEETKQEEWEKENVEEE